ncbi:MAG: hypothetical protein E7310_06150 [Clostridiales bacterium]|nr:hypothetical protein [Clostridiales bacterium]
MHKLCRLTGDEIRALVPIVQSQEYTEYARSHSKEDVETYLVEELALYRQRRTVEEGRYLADKEAEEAKKALGAIAKGQRKAPVEKRAVSLQNATTRWLNPKTIETKDKPEGKGE